MNQKVTYKPCFGLIRLKLFSLSFTLQQFVPLLLRGRVHGAAVSDQLGRLLVRPLPQRGHLHGPGCRPRLHLSPGIHRWVVASPSELPSLYIVIAVNVTVVVVRVAVWGSLGIIGVLGVSGICRGSLITLLAV